MGAFGIFAFVVTFAYVVYYVVVYNMDTHKKTDSKSDTEVIDVPGSVTGIPDDPPTLVVETSNGKYTIPGNDNEADDEMEDSFIHFSAYTKKSRTVSEDLYLFAI